MIANNGNETLGARTWGELLMERRGGPFVSVQDLRDGMTVGGIFVSYDLLQAELALQGKTVEKFLHLPEPQSNVTELIPRQEAQVEVAAQVDILPSIAS